MRGYSCKDLSFRSVSGPLKGSETATQVRENLRESCYVPRAKVRKLADEIIAMSEKHGLDVSQFGGKAPRFGGVWQPRGVPKRQGGSPYAALHQAQAGGQVGVRSQALWACG